MKISKEIIIENLWLALERKASITESYDVVNSTALILMLGKHLIFLWQTVEQPH